MRQVEERMAAHRKETKAQVKAHDTKAQLNKQKFQKPEGKNYMEVPREARKKHQSSTAKLADNGEEEQAFMLQLIGANVDQVS